MRFTFYKADSVYCDFLRKCDSHVPYTMDNKSIRPFVGIIFSVNGYNYYAPLTSPKPKHLAMRNQIDFLKIDGGRLGAINFNNMIPIHMRSLQKADVKILPDDDKTIMNYKNLLTNQLYWCNNTENAALILNKAKKLYGAITNKTARPELAKRCCDFSKLEQQYLLYCKNHGFDVNNKADTCDLVKSFQTAQHGCCDMQAEEEMERE